MSVTILQGDCRDVLPTLEAGSVQCCITSPPYFGLRDYGMDGQLGLEQTPSAYVEHMVAVFREVWRILRDDGTLWLNIGDSYVNNPSTSDIPRAEQGNGSGIFKVPPQKHFDARRQRANAAQPMIDAGLKKKDLIGIPWMLAFALRADGWYLRSDIIWHKPNVMPESVTDRPTKAHEYLFLLSKQERYYYDADAIREPHARLWDEKNGGDLGGTDRNDQALLGGKGRAGRPPALPHPAGRNKRSVWTVATSPYPGAHYATFPEALVEPCILAGSSPQACEVCGAPWARVVERCNPSKGTNTGYDMTNGAAKTSNPQTSAGLHRNGGGVYSSAVTTGWQPTCNHDNAGMGRCVVLDPFFGSGTTGRVALKHGRDCIGIELNPQYIEQAECRTDGVQTMMDVAV